MKKALLILIFLQISLFSTLYATNIKEDKKNSLQKEIITKEKIFIQLSDVPIKAVETLEKLKDITNTLETKGKVHDIHNAIPKSTSTVNKLLSDPSYKYMDHLSIRFIQKKHTEFSTYLLQFEQWNKILSDKMNIYDEKRKLLENYSELWAQTSVEANKEKAPKVIVTHITSVIIKIEELRNRTKKYFDTLLTDSNVITTKNLEIKTIMKKLKESEIKLSNEVFKQNELPFFTIIFEQNFKPIEYLKNIYYTSKENIQEFKNYLNTHQNKFLFFLISLILNTSFVLYFNYLYRKRKLFIRKESLNRKDFYFIKRPFSTILILLALYDIFIFPQMPKVVSDIHLLFILIPIFRIIQTVVPRSALKYFYQFSALYIVFLIQRNGIGFSIDSRLTNILLDFIFIIFLVSVLKNNILNNILKPFISKYIYKLFALFSVLLIISIFSNLYGAVLLSNRILDSIFTIIYSSLIFYSLNIILTGYITVILRRRMATATDLIEEFSLKIEKNTTKAIKIIMFLWWFIVTMKTIAIYPYILNFIHSFLNLSWTIANTTISIQAIFDFIIIVIGTWLLSKFVNAVLEVELFSRFEMPRGVPTAIKTISNYTIIISGTIIALSSLGVSPQQFALVFGALGVGIGFGLRNIIANFVSGVIMVFERPIQIGDTIQVDKTMGNVQSIGARASTIKTFDGSEVIIPNADFVAKEITNWTLSDERRRKVLEFKVDFDSDIEVVMEIMRKVAISHKDVLKDPEPLATFNGFGDYYLNFKLYFWLTENLIVAQSDIAIGVYNSLKEANIKMPMPKQEQLNKTS